MSVNSNLQRYYYMSAKMVIQGLPDCQLVRVFLDFTREYGLKYEKGYKEISYKCYEATWMLDNNQATGYGRSEQEAYKSALKNLVQMLMEQAAYVEYFAEILRKYYQTKSNVKQYSPTAKMQLKTQGYEPEDKNKRNNQNYSKIQFSGKIRQQVFHSKINLNLSASTSKDSSKLQQAQVKLKALELRLSTVLAQNKKLKQQLAGEQPNQERVSFKKNVSLQRKVLVESKQSNLLQLKQDKYYQKPVKAQPQNKQKQLIPKISVPKLNLNVLPNYHKRSQKCLNEMLLAAYKQKHEGIVKNRV